MSLSGAPLCKDSGLYRMRRAGKAFFCIEEGKQNFFEKTRYAGIQYGTKKEDIEDVLLRGKYAVMPLDMCGAIAMKRHFPTTIIYVARDKEVLIKDIIEQDYPVEEKTLRILSIDAEKRNRQICDHVVYNGTIEEGAENLLGCIS